MHPRKAGGPAHLGASLRAQLLAVALTLGLLGTGAVVLGVGAAQATAASGTHLVPGWLAGISRATRIGAPPAGTQMTVGVAVNGPHPAAEAALQAAMYDRSSPEYHHFLTVAQFQRRFGVSPATTAAVKAFLTSGGLTVTDVEPGGAYILATGAPAQLDRLFNVTISRYSYGDHTFLANNVAPSVPDSLPIRAVLGLNTVDKMSLASLTGHRVAGLPTLQRAAAVRAFLVRQHKRAAHAKLIPGVGIQSGNEQVYTPQELWGIYNMPGATTLPNPTTGLTTPAELASSHEALGQGQKIGIIGEGETSSVTAQLRLFENAVGLPKIPVRTIETEGGPDSAYGDNTGAIEWYLDSQSSTGMAPDAKQLDFFFAKTLYDADILSAFSAWANDPTGPAEMNASFGECEANPTNPVSGPLAQQPYGTELGDELEAGAEPVLEQATMEGRTLFAAAGDTGSGCPEVAIPVAGAGNGVAPQPVPLVNYPCASAYVVCVGGTVVSSPGTTYPTGANKQSAMTSWSTGGGGSSEFIPAPSWQSKVAHINHDCISNASGSVVYTGNAPLCRGVPDVADLSGNITGDGYFIYIDGNPSSEGGTSLSSPLMMGQWARIQSAAAAKVQAAGGNGFADPLIYQLASSADTCSAAPCGGQYGQDFYDITASETDTGNGVYQPGPGWDYASGWGSLNVSDFMQAADGETTSPVSYTGTERPAVSVCTASMNSPVGNATDPADVSLGNQPGADLTNATLSSPSAAKITATWTVPDLSQGVPPDSNSLTFYVAWEYHGLVYYAQAVESSGGGFTYSSGNTGPFETKGSPNFGSYTDTAGSAATGSVNTTTGVITVTVPTSEVGSPSAGALLTDPQAFDQVTLGTIDSSDNLAPYSTDQGRTDSVGVNVVVGGVKGSNCSPMPAGTAPVHPTTPASPKGPTTTKKRHNHAAGCQTRSEMPVTHITAKRLNARFLQLRGDAFAHCPDRIVHVGIAIARVRRFHRRLECAFLTGRHRFTRFGGCRPHDYLRARGTTRWTFFLRVHLRPGVYHIWEHALDNRHRATRNVAGRYVFLRVR
ncbi:protease pro-enzyme activation domain-containing protein [Conexibacter sp. DBS9H8]|uniref:protease pro-enzyme activation domain-containing protein n=1 Tax=Conexibacter sp. DBS9H8 TaxID=2937801 RepID=UPI00200CEA66|nr:protease pro-enzyme activation domain-containing protein [Conexibacter sp. DBS9H8]